MPDEVEIKCPKCGTKVKVLRNPLLTVDIVIRMGDSGIVLIERKNPPHGWALPGGFVDYGESLEAAALREAREETGLELEDLQQFRAYSDPGRDPRHHTVTVVFTSLGRGTLRGADDARQARVFQPSELPDNLAFDHGKILSDYLEAQGKNSG